MILVVGAGAVGTILCAHLMKAGRESVRLYARDKDVSRFEGLTDIRVEHSDPRRPPVVSPVPPLTRTLALDEIRYLLLCVKFPDLDQVLDQLGDIPPGCTIVSTLNGLHALRRIRERFPQATLAPMSVMFNGQLLAPLHARITTRAQVFIGTDDPRLLHAFDGSAMNVQQSRGDAAAWGKLLINLANAICALTHTTFRDLLTQADLRKIYVAVLDEAIQTLERAGVDYQLPMPIPYAVYRGLLAGRTPLPWWFAKLRNGLRNGAYPSMVSDIEGGRRTEVDQLNGEIVTLGASRGIATPINARMVAMIHEMENFSVPAYLSPADLRARLVL